MRNSSSRACTHMYLCMRACACVPVLSVHLSICVCVCVCVCVSVWHAESSNSTRRSGGDGGGGDGWVEQKRKRHDMAFQSASLQTYALFFALLDQVLQAIECARGNEEDVARVHLDRLAARVLATAFLRNVHNGACSCTRAHYR